MYNNEEKKPRILIVSNNPLSNTENNGKTLASFFDRYPTKKIAQLYFNDANPDNNKFDNFYRISDKDIVRALIKSEDKCGIRVNACEDGIITNNSKNNRELFEKLKKYNLSRIAREIIWSRETWISNDLEKWLDEFSPQIIFFCAGDSGFAYSIVQFIQKKYNTKLVVFITDDYITKRFCFSPFWWIRRNYILKNMKNIINMSDLFVTISEKMRVSYKEIFQKDSILAVNMSEPLKNELYNKEKNKDIELVYAGGFHYNRYKILGLIGKNIRDINNTSNRNIRLKIYSTQKPSDKVLSWINIDNASEFCGPVNKIELERVLNKCDMPVFVESFERKSIEATRLSLSTKIPEYLSLGKPIIAVGPKEVSSMDYLKDCAFCITNYKEIREKMEEIINDLELQSELSKKSLEKYYDNHDKEKVSEKLISNILKIYY